MGKLDGKVGFITGASQGLGRGIAMALAGEGCHVVMTARSEETLKSAAESVSALGAQVLARPSDMTDPRQVDDVFADALDRFGRLDILVNNAGAFDGGPLDEISVETWDTVIATNLRAPFLCTRAAMRIMKKQGGGRIINVGSISAQRVRPNAAPYNTSKHGLVGLTHTTALEGRDYGITCGCLHPGNINVERRAASTAPEDQEPMMSVAEVAEVALLMATLPPHVEMLDAVVLPHRQLYVGRG